MGGALTIRFYPCDQQLLRSIKGRFMFSFHIDSDFDILFEMLTARIGIMPNLGTQPHFHVPSDLQIGIVNTQ